MQEALLYKMASNLFKQAEHEKYIKLKNIFLYALES